MSLCVYFFFLLFALSVVLCALFFYIFCSRLFREWNRYLDSFYAATKMQPNKSTRHDCEIYIYRKRILAKVECRIIIGLPFRYYLLHFCPCVCVCFILLLLSNGEQMNRNRFISISIYHNSDLYTLHTSIHRKKGYYECRKKNFPQRPHADLSIVCSRNGKTITIHISRYANDAQKILRPIDKVNERER